MYISVGSVFTTKVETKKLEVLFTSNGVFKNEVTNPTN